MLVPKKYKFKKRFKGKIKGETLRGSLIRFGQYAFKSLEIGQLTQKQIETSSKIIFKRIKKAGRVWIRIFPDQPVSSKSTGIRMGKGKGSVDTYVAAVKPGQIIFEISNIPESKLKSIFLNVSKKLPIKTKIIVRKKNNIISAA